MLFLYLFIDLWARVMLVRPTVALANSEVWKYDDAAINGSGEHRRVTVTSNERANGSNTANGVMSCHVDERDVTKKKEKRNEWRDVVSANRVNECHK